MVGLRNNWQTLCRPCFLKGINQPTLAGATVFLKDILKHNLIIHDDKFISPIGEAGTFNNYPYKLIADNGIYKLRLECDTSVTREVVNHIINCFTRAPTCVTSDEESNIVHTIMEQLRNSIVVAEANPNKYYPHLATIAPGITFYPVWDTNMKCTLVANTPYNKQDGFIDVEIVTVINIFGYESIKAEQRKSLKKRETFNTNV